MNEILAVVGSITGAVRLQKDLNRKGYLKVYAVNTPTCLNSGGCSYSLKFSEDIKQAFFGAANRRRIKIRGLYKIVKDETGAVVYEIIS